MLFPEKEREARAGWPSLPPFFSRDLWLIWLLRADIRGPGSQWDEERGRKFLLWWLLEGRHDYPGAAPLSPEEIGRAFSPVRIYAGSRFFELPLLLAELWSGRSELRAQYRGSSESDIEALLRWFYVKAVPEFRLFDVLPALHLAFLREPRAHSGFAALPLTRLMVWVSRLRPDLEALYPLATAAGRTRFVAWFYLRGAMEMGLLPYIGEAERRALSSPVSKASPVPLADRLLELCPSGWPPSAAPRQHPFSANVREGDALRRPSGGPKALSSPVRAAAKERLLRHDGVNLFGFPRGQFGLGEDIRMAAAALAAARVPYSVLALKEHSDWRHHDRSLDHRIGEDAPFAITLACLPGIDTALSRLRLEEAIWAGRHIIGWWPWELPAWPVCLRPAFELVDEVWASTRYTREAYAPGCPVPVMLMPPAVAVDRLRARSRADLGLAEKAFLFLLVFDGNSTLARKNPEAAVAAFREAFPRGDEPVGLVLKGMNGADAPGWKDLLKASREDSRILLIDEIWEREEVLSLLAASDAFLSLHRAEGFGRLLAEAMLLEKPVIATDFSGSADFLSAATGFPVPFSLRRIAREEYPFGEGQFWAEPDIAEAARTMVRVVADPAGARPLARAGRALLRERFSPAAAGARIKRRLLELGLESARL